MPLVDPNAPHLAPLPSGGRVFRTSRRVRLGDVSSSGQLRLDAIARYLQDSARDDSADSGLRNPMAWVVRRTFVRVVQSPVFQEELGLATWCSGVGSRWAERRTSITGADGGSVEAAAIWVHVDPETGRPARLGPDFSALYGESADGRAVDARLAHESRPPDGARCQAWPWRVTDFDILGHVNNAAYGAAIVEAMAGTDGFANAWQAELEYRDPALPGSEGQLAIVTDGGSLAAWVLADDRVCCTALVSRR